MNSTIYDSELQKVPKGDGPRMRTAVEEFVFDQKRIVAVDLFPWPANTPCAYWSIPHNDTIWIKGKIEESPCRFIDHVVTWSLITHEFSPLRLNIGSLLTNPHTWVLFPHLSYLGSPIHVLSNLEELLFGGVYFHEFDPMTHTSQDHASTGVLQQHMTCWSFELTYFGAKMGVGYRYSGDYCEDLQFVDIVVQVLTIDTVDNGSTCSLDVASAALRHIAHYLQLRWWAFLQQSTIESYLKRSGMFGDFYEGIRA